MMKYYNLFSILTVLISIIILAGQLNLLILLPVSYIIAKLIISRVSNYNIIITKYIYDFLGVLRLLIIPTLMVIFNNYKVDNLPIGYNYFNKGILLICLEYIIGALFLLFFSKLFKSSVKKDRNFLLAGSQLFYLLFIVVSSLLVLAMPDVRNTMSFLIIKTNASGRDSEDVANYIVLVRMFFQLALALLFLIMTHRSYLMYRKKPQISLLILPILTGLVNISLIIGERRSIQLYSLLAVIIIISYVFRYHYKRINILIFFAGFVILMLMTLYKELYIFNYNSYGEALSQTSFSNVKFVDQLQSYFFGPHNVAAALDFLNYYKVGFNQLFYDIGRSLFGFNMVIDKSQLLTSQLFNRIIYGDRQLTGHLISSAGYGYIYFGPLLFYIIIAFNLLITISLEFLIKKTDKLEFVFIGTYLFMRCGQNIFGNPSPIITFTTSVIAVYGLIILLGMFFKSTLKRSV